jgi:hypothetical protein
MRVELASGDGCVDVRDRTSTTMSEDPATGPRLRAAGVRQRFALTDLAHRDPVAAEYPQLEV